MAPVRPLLERSLTIREKALGPEHPYVARSLNDLAVLLRDQRDFAGARPLFERALATFEKVIGLEHPDSNLVRCDLSRLLIQIGSLTEALALSESALAAHNKVLGPKHSWTKNSARVTADAAHRGGEGAAGEVWAHGRREVQRLLKNSVRYREAGSSGPSLVDGWGRATLNHHRRLKARAIELNVHVLLTFLPKHLASANVLSTP
jgi:Tetratricopeptide repeat